MLNILRMDLYRMLHSHLTGVLLLFLAVLLLSDGKYLAADAAGGSLLSSSETRAEQETAEPAEPALKPYRLSEPQLERALTSAPDLLSLDTFCLLLFLTLYIPLFISAVYRHGFLRNIAGKFPSRLPLALGRILAFAVLDLILVGFYTVVQISVIAFAFGRRFHVGPPSELLGYLGVLFLLCLGYTALLVFVSDLARRRSRALPPILLLILFAGRLHLVQPWLPLDQAARQSLGRLSLPGLLMTSGPQIHTGTHLAWSAVCALLYLLVFTGLSLLLLQRRDIR